MKLVNITAMLLLFTGSVFAQKYKLGEVTVAELEEKAHPKDPDAPAAVLFSKCENYMEYSQGKGFMLFTEVEMKIKIYTKAGYDYANKQVQYYNSGGNSEKVDIAKSYTYNLVGGKIEKTKLSSDGEFDEVVNENWRLKKIMMPNVKEGSIVEFKYTIVSPFESVMPEWKFQEGIPVNHSELTTKIPEYYVFSPNYRGFYTPVTTRSKNSRSVMLTSKERSGNRVVTTTFNTDKVVYSEDVTTYVLDDLPGMRNEKYISNIDNYTAGIEHELSVVKWPNEPVKSYSHSWEDVVKTIYDSENFGGELKKTGYFEDDINALIAPLKTPEEKTAAIFAYVKTQMNWNERYGHNCSGGVRKAYKEKTGNVAEINLMLTAMLRHAGLDANPVLTSTRAHGIAVFPTRTAFNYVICAVKIGDKQYLLDATSKYTAPNILPVRTINWMGRLIKKNGDNEEVELITPGISKEQKSMQCEMQPNGVLTGRMRSTYVDYDAYLFREKYAEKSEDSFVERLEKKYKDITIGDFKADNVKDVTKPVSEEYTFTHQGAADVSGNKIYFNPLLFLAQTINPFKQDKREFPIDFVYAYQERTSVSIKIPQGYSVESMPEKIQLALDGNIGSFNYVLQQNGDVIQIVALEQMMLPIISQDYYGAIKDFFGKMANKQKEKIVLKKN